VFQTVYSVPHPVFLLEGPPPGKKTPLETLDNPEFEKRMRAHNGDMLRASIEDPYETEIRVGRAPYMWAKIIEALMDPLRHSMHGTAVICIRSMDLQTTVRRKSESLSSHLKSHKDDGIDAPSESCSKPLPLC